jgi:hypothetical protein
MRMICALEVLALIYGIMTLVRGRFSWGKTKEVRGAPAYVIGVVLMATIPLAMLLWVIFNFDELQKGGPPQFRMDARAVLPEIVAVAVCWGSALLIAGFTARPKVHPRMLEYDDEYDDEDFRPRRRRSRDYDDDEDDRPRRRPADYRDADDRPTRPRDDLDERAR